MDALIVIPAYNEQECLARTVAELEGACPGLDYLVVNDGSTDRTGTICRELGLPHVSLPVNCGLAAAFQTGARYALRHGYDAIIQFDADGQHIPTYIPAMIEAMGATGADIVIASRALAGAGPTGARGVGSRLISWLIRLTTGVRITDPTSGLRLYNRRMTELFAQGFDLAPEPDTVALVARRGGCVVEVAALMRERQGGKSYLDAPHVVGYMARTCLSILMFQWFR